MPNAMLSLKANDESIQAMVIYNLLNFVQWPASAFDNSKAAIKICLYGQVDFAQQIVIFQNVTVRGRSLNFQQYKQLSQIQTGCHLLYVGEDKRQQLEQIFNNFDHYYVLSVSSVDGFVSQGGVLNILRTSDQQRFEINLQRARQNGLSLSSDLLELSRVINQ